MRGTAGRRGTPWQKLETAPHAQHHLREPPQLGRPPVHSREATATAHRACGPGGCGAEKHTDERRKRKWAAASARTQRSYPTGRKPSSSSTKAQPASSGDHGITEEDPERREHPAGLYHAPYRWWCRAMRVLKPHTADRHEHRHWRSSKSYHRKAAEKDAPSKDVPPVTATQSMTPDRIDHRAVLT